MKVTPVIKDLVTKAQAALNGQIARKGDKFTADEVQAGVQAGAEVLQKAGVDATVLREASFAAALAALLNGEPLEVEQLPLADPPEGADKKPAVDDKKPPVEEPGDNGEAAAGGDNNNGDAAPPPAGESGWAKWGSLGLIVLGALALVGSIFTSEEGAKTKPILAALGGFLVGAPLVAKYKDSLGWLVSLLGGDGGEKPPAAPGDQTAPPAEQAVEEKPAEKTTGE